MLAERGKDCQSVSTNSSPSSIQLFFILLIFFLLLIVVVLFVLIVAVFDLVTSYPPRKEWCHPLLLLWHLPLLFLLHHLIFVLVFVAVVGIILVPGEKSEGEMEKGRWCLET